MTYTKQERLLYEYVGAVPTLDPRVVWLNLVGRAEPAR
jgi:hypothetical protein